MTHEFIEKLADPIQIKQVMANALRKGDAEAYNRAFRRFCSVTGATHDDPDDSLVRAFWETLAAYEMLLAEKHGRTQPAGYTRRKVKEQGVLRCLVDWANATGPTVGFNLLVEKGMWELTGEALVLRYADRFDGNTVSNARKRLEKAGVRA